MNSLIFSGLCFSEKYFKILLKTLENRMVAIVSLRRQRLLPCLLEN